MNVTSETRPRSSEPHHAGDGSTAPGEGSLVFDILSIIEDAGEIVGARTLRRELLARGYSMSESSVSRQLTVLDTEGMTVLHGQRGRTLSTSGQSALRSLVADKRRRVLFQDAFDVTRVEDLLELLEARVCVESGVARIAALHASSQDLERLRSSLNSDTSGSGDSRSSAIPATERLSFHRVLGRSCGNKVMVALSESLFDARLEALEEVHDLIALMSGTYELAHGEHTEILVAVEARDPDAAAVAMASHLGRLISELKEYARSTPPKSIDRLVSAVRP